LLPEATHCPSDQTNVTDLSIVIPVYRSAEILPELAAELDRTLPSIADRFEVIFVNDGSPDDSWEVLQSLQSQYAWLRAIGLMRNYGQHNAILAGVRHTTFDVIVTMDDDLQHPPEEIPKLIEAIEAGADVVYGPPLQQQHGLWRDLASALTKRVLQNVMGAETARNVSAFRAFRRACIAAFGDYRGPFANIDVMLTWATRKFEAVPVRHDPRFAGESNYTFRKLVIHALNMMTGFTVLPLQIASLGGIFFAIFGLVVLAFVVGRYLLEGTPVPGFPFLASIISIYSGATLFAIGVIGEYLARMHFRIMDKPTYVIRDEIGGRGE
jgi:undecaprenyl-phosphate 4-deoxy-4-formamido-L-arabinose transferase